MNIDKKSLRKELLLKRQSISLQEKTRLDHILCQKIAQYLFEHHIKSVGAYTPIKGEPDLSPLYETLSSQNIVLSLPVVIHKESPLLFAKWAPGDATVLDAFGIATPLKKDFIQPEALLVPCLGFSSNGFRLGYGGGFFDRTLEQKPRPKTIGVAYSFLETSFDIQAHDIALDTIITD